MDMGNYPRAALHGKVYGQWPHRRPTRVDNMWGVATERNQWRNIIHHVGCHSSRLCLSTMPRQ